ncbi:MAG: cytochrome ubiquinol oxidase subunit I [Deltaproteobacteria bacterium]|nr:cytochrome ubiquinol oxidase subunit I [Deltaproteobacteria bacterium]
METVLLARVQFALTVGFHYIFPAITIGMAWNLVWMLTRYLKTSDPVDRAVARFWIRIFALTFALGVATGITMEFQFGMNWASYSRFVGDIFGAPLAAEGILAFFLESSFLGILLFGERRVSKRVYWFSGLMVALGSTLSGFWIIVANSWQQTPAGYRIINGRAELVDFWAALFNPSTVPRFLHTIDGALIAGSFFILGISAYFLLRGEHREFAKRSFSIALFIGFFSSALIVPLGHFHGVQVAQTQPAKLAALEGIWETQSDAPLLIFGIPNREKEKTDFELGIRGLLSIGVGGTRDTVVQGLKDFPKDQWPPLLPSFASFHLMVGLGFYFVALTGLAVLLLWRKKLYDNRLFLWLTLFSLPLPIVANELGWMAAEIGRQPWVVYGLMRTEDAVSQVVPASQILTSIILFSLIYLLLFALWIYLLKHKINKGPDANDARDEGAREVAE